MGLCVRKKGNGYSSWYVKHREEDMYSSSTIKIFGAGPSINDEIEGVGGVGAIGGEWIGEVPLIGAEAIDLGADAANEGEDRVEVSGVGEGTGGGDLVSNSVGRRTFSILKMDIDTESGAMLSTLDESTPDTSVTESPLV
ncbi:hypothetical protein L6452_02700 [Arctium lappa]|uniref:Uncharacterized protein n=1 Tax=Arctium lappa TaxID=4217 RepID=A0ACB9FL52_ARCLA|nr:hypothetical protein L6452_02700 [Arctium lappa]